MRIHVWVMRMMIPRVLRDVIVTHVRRYFGRSHMIPRETLRTHWRGRTDSIWQGSLLPGQRITRSIRFWHQGWGRHKGWRASSCSMRWGWLCFRSLRRGLRGWRRSGSLFFKLQWSWSSRTRSISSSCTTSSWSSWRLICLQHLLELRSTILKPNLDLETRKGQRVSEWERERERVKETQRKRETGREGKERKRKIIYGWVTLKTMEKWTVSQ